MIRFHVVHVSQTKDVGPGMFTNGYAVFRSDGDGLEGAFVSRLYKSIHEAEAEAQRLVKQAQAGAA